MDFYARSGAPEKSPVFNLPNGSQVFEMSGGEMVFRVANDQNVSGIRINVDEANANVIGGSIEIHPPLDRHFKICSREIGRAHV